jgi:hypothetical protein
VVRRPRGGHRFLKLKFWFSWWKLVKLETGWGLRWKAEDRQLRKSESVMWKADISKVVAPAYIG